MKDLSYQWNLRSMMADRGMFSTTDLMPHLTDRGITLSREQVYRLVTGHPQRMTMQTLVALCDILECTPNDLIEPQVTVASSPKKAVGQIKSSITSNDSRRTTIRRPSDNE